MARRLVALLLLRRLPLGRVHVLLRADRGSQGRGDRKQANASLDHVVSSELSMAGTLKRCMQAATGSHAL
jgi:hypothetical protein